MPECEKPAFRIVYVDSIDKSTLCSQFGICRVNDIETCMLEKEETCERAICGHSDCPYSCNACGEDWLINQCIIHIDYRTISEKIDSVEDE